MKRIVTNPAQIPLTDSRPPRVLLLGNGILRLCRGVSWSELLEGLRSREVSDTDLKAVPYCMQPELLCDAEAEVIRRQVGAHMAAAAPCISPQLEALLALDFDCILTTNYSYEVEEILTGGQWNEKARRRCLHVADGAPGAHNNLSICYAIPRKDRSPVQVWHIHGDTLRHTTLILSYYSYAASIYRLQEYNKRLGNALEEHQQSGNALTVRSWLDWFLAGDVFSVGYGYDFSEIDLWWALERKKREKADVGQLIYLNLETEKPAANRQLLEALGARYEGIPVENGSWVRAYDRLIARLKEIAFAAAHPAADSDI